MSHSYFQKHRKTFLPFVHNTVKHHVENFIPNKIPAYSVGARDLIDTNQIKMHGNPRGQESLMYGYGKGLPVQNKVEEKIKNKYSQAQVDNLDSSSYNNFRK